MTDERTYAVAGMSCDHCVRAVEREVGAVPGVTSAVADLGAGSLAVRGEGIDDARVAAAVAEAGYEMAS